MEMRDVSIGQKVRERTSGEIGTVERIDWEDYMVWVRFSPVNGVEQVLDIHPDDLEYLK